MPSKLLPALFTLAAVAGPATDPYRMEVILERQKDAASGWDVVDPGHIFDRQDHVRFRFKANFGGYLYVMNFGTSGRYSLLFPTGDTGRMNRIQAGQEQRIPATSAFFRVEGPPGHDVVYWLVSPAQLDGAIRLRLPEKPKKPAVLLPRCDDTIFRARGVCVDSSAGPRHVAQGEELPENLSGVAGARSRELVIMRRQDSSLISSPEPLKGPVLYEFRLSHR